jgi:hypothetical protein
MVDVPEVPLRPLQLQVQRRPNVTLRAVVDGREWRTYTCSYDTADGKFAFTIMAISMEHAAAMLEELRATAKLDGELDEVIDAK